MTTFGSVCSGIEVPMTDLAMRKCEMATYQIEPVGVLFKTDGGTVGVVTNGGAFFWLDENKDLCACLGVKRE